MLPLDQLFAAYQPLLSQEQNRDARIWVFPSDEPSQFLDGDKIFSCGDTSICIIDHYWGRAPWLLNHEYAQGGKIEVKYVPTVILDSHIVSYLRDYTNSSESMSRTRRRAVQQLLDYMVIRNWDYNPAFYWLEAARDFGSEKHIRECTEAIFRLHSMDKEHFLRTGQVVLDQRRVRVQLDKYNVESLDEVAAAVTSDLLLNSPFAAMKMQAELSYAVLLKMILIEAGTRGRSIIEKARTLQEFVVDTLRISVARELLTGMFYFSGKSGKLIPRLQQNSNREEVLRKTRSASWDLTLLRIPEALFAFPPNEPTPISYVCTGERALQAIGRSFQIIEIRSLPPTTKVCTAVVGLHWSDLRDTVSDTEADQLHVLQMESHKRLTESRKDGQIAAIPESELPNLVAELEDQLRRKVVGV